MPHSLEQIEAAFQRATREGEEALRQSLMAALRQARKRLLEQDLPSDASQLEIAAARTGAEGEVEPKAAGPNSRAAQLAMSTLLERLRSQTNPTLQRLAELATSLDSTLSKALINTLRPGQCVRMLAQAMRGLTLSDQAWLVTGKITERRLLNDLPVVISQLRGQLQPLLVRRGAPPFLLHRPRQAGNNGTKAGTVPTNAILEQAIWELQSEIHNGQLRVADLRGLRTALTSTLATKLGVAGRQVRLETDQESALEAALCVVQPILTESARLPGAFASLFRGLFLVVVAEQLVRPEHFRAAEAPWQWLLDEIRLALRDGGARTHWATRAVCTLLETRHPDIGLIKSLLSAAPSRHQPAQLLSEGDTDAAPLSTQALQTVLKWLRHHEHLPPHARQMLRRSWSRVLLEIAHQHGVDSSHYQHAENTGQRLCLFYESKAPETRETRLLLREVRTGLDGLADHSDEAVKVINDLARAAGTARQEDRSDAHGRVWPRLMRTGQWIEWEPRPGEKSRGRLSWISPFSGNYLFVGPFGRRMLELPPVALVQAMEDGRMRLTDSAGTVERSATSELLARMQSLVTAPSPRET